MSKKRRRPRAPKTEQKSPISPLMIGVIVVAAFLIVGGLILLGNQGGNTVASGSFDTGQYPTLGDAGAPVTMIEFSDYG